MRITFAGLPAYGHLYPMMPLAVACARAGHQVALGTGAPFVGALPVPTFQMLPPDADLSWAETETARRHPGITGMEFGLTMFAEVTAEVVATGLLRAFDVERPDLVVYEGSCVGAGIAAGVLGIPALVFAVGQWHPFAPPLHALAIESGARFWTDRGLVPPTGALLAGGIVDPLPPSWTCSGGFRPAAPDSAAHPGLERRRRHSRLADDARPPAARLRHAGHRRLRRGGRIAARGARDGGRGSRGAGRGRPGATRTCSVGCRSRCTWSGSWRRTRCCRWSTWSSITGGHGTMLGALAAGIPQVIMPQGADQFFNGQRLAEIGAGRVVPNEAPDGAITAAVRGCSTAPPSARWRSRSPPRSPQCRPRPRWSARWWGSRRGGRRSRRPRVADRHVGDLQERITAAAGQPGQGARPLTGERATRARGPTSARRRGRCSPRAARRRCGRSGRRRRSACRSGA